MKLCIEIAVAILLLIATPPSTFGNDCGDNYLITFPPEEETTPSEGEDSSTTEEATTERTQATTDATITEAPTTDATTSTKADISSTTSEDATTTAVTEASTESSTTEASTTDVSTTEASTTAATTSAATKVSSEKCVSLTTTQCSIIKTTAPPCSASSDSTTIEAASHLELLTINDCISRPNGFILLSSGHCRRYYICQQGGAKHYRCPINQWFDRQTLTCRARSLVTNCPANKS